MFRQIIISSLVFLCCTPLVAQGELNATVRVNTPQLQKNDRKVFDQLEASLREFLNNTKWTNDNFDSEERIKCNFILTISKELDNNFFEGELAARGKTRADFANEKYAAGPLDEQRFFRPTACTRGEGVRADGLGVWKGGNARYV